MKLNAGLNNLYPTTVSLDNITVIQEYIDLAITLEIHSDLYKLATSIFDNYIQATLPETIDSWDYKIDGWINCYQQNEMEYHTHSGAALSTVIYLMNDADGGEITFYDPRHFAARGYDMRFRPLFDPISYKPKTGEVITFPSYLYHAVKPTKGFRISAAFDLYLSDKRN
jgi:uncharacterized protein (TIGR02466 family)